MKAKADGDKATANALKLVCNTTYGAMLNQYNDLYDPLMGRSVCISGQLYLLELSIHLFKEVPGLKIIQLNTDGIMVEFDDSHYIEVLKITNEWQERTGFEVEEDSVIKLIQKDVNGYIEVQSNNQVKCKGGYLVKGISPAGAFNINNNAVIVATAIKEYFVNGTPVEDTIKSCNDISQFQMIAKAGQKYKEAYHIVDGQKQPIQKVNRVYATSNPKYGKLYKVKAENDSEAKIDSLPERCIIDNENKLTIDEVDKTFYIEMAQKRVNDFLGIQPDKKPKGGKKMATTKANNVFQKLLTARKMFLQGGVSKSGKNFQIQYEYFELKDIVPLATEIFTELGLIGLVSFSDEKATMTIVNTDNPEETIVFESPMRYPSENKAINPVQALGGSQTYLRRYLYLVALDIVEADSIEPTTEPEKPVNVTVKPKTPATAEERKEIKEELTAVDDKASDLQIKQLKKVLTQLRQKDPDKDEMMAEIACKTNGFTEISKADCETIITKVTAMLEE